MYKKYIKRLLDIICSLLAIIVFCWLYAIVAILVRINLGSPIIFAHERPGKNEKIFKLYKFRSMTNECDEKGNLLPGEQRLTKFGRTLRRTSLDELPEVWNILRGDMSIVGPRPLEVRYLPRYNKEQHRRHEIRPGLTGWAQVNGRNAITWEEKFKLDVWYVDHYNFRLDIKILFMTIKKAFLRQEGIGGETSDIVKEFMGTENTGTEEK